MDITGESPQRRQLGITLFLEGEDSLVYEGVVFRKDREGHLVVASFSEFIHIENVTRAEATKKIERSIEVFEDLKGENPEFAAAVSTLPCEYHFCFDTGKAGILVASVRDNEMEWHLINAKTANQSLKRDAP